MIVDRIPEMLLAPEASLRRLDGDVTQQKLNLLQFAACLMAQSGTGRRQGVSEPQRTMILKVLTNRIRLCNASQ